jgi:hypothetical protein
MLIRYVKITHPAITRQLEIYTAFWQCHLYVTRKPEHVVSFNETEAPKCKYYA